MFKACEQFFRLPNWTTQETVVASRLDCEHERQEFIVDSGASLHMMSKNELTSGGEKMPSADSKEPTVITTANGKGRVDRRCDSLRQRFGRLCYTDAVGRFTAVLSLSLLCEEMVRSNEWSLPP